MAWQTPVTNRLGPETKTTAADMNRIAGNLNELTAGTLKADYTDNDIVLLEDWTAIIETAQFWNQEITAATTWTNLNLIEATTEAAHNGGTLPADNLYPSETLYPRSE